MANKMDIVNMAMANLGADFIGSLDEPGKEAAMIKYHFDTTLGDILSSYSWGFAFRRASLAPFPEKPLGCDYAYAYPADCVKALRVRPECRDVSCVFEVGRSPDGRQKAVLTDCPPVAWIEYITRLVDVSELPDKFVEAFSWRLSAAIALGVNNDPSTYQLHMQTYGLLREEARALDASEVHFPRLPDGGFLKSRLGI